jgi:hypothetical protein
LRSVDTLALVLRSQIALRSLELEEDELVELPVLVALVRCFLSLCALTSERRAEVAETLLQFFDPRGSLVAHEVRVVIIVRRDGRGSW